MGRWRSVAETIDRRFPSARKRPGAGSFPVLAPGRLRGLLRWFGGWPMSLWRRAPRQVYRVYGEDEYLAEEHVADESEDLRCVERSGLGENQAEVEVSPAVGGRKRGPEVGSLSFTGSRTPRLVGVGLLLGVTVGAAGLVLSHLTHEASPSRGPSGAHSAQRRAPTNSGVTPRHASERTSEDLEAERRSNRMSTVYQARSAITQSGVVARERASGSAVAARQSSEARRSASAEPNRSARGASEALVSFEAPVSAETTPPSEASVSSAASVGEFEFER